MGSEKQLILDRQTSLGYVVNHLARLMEQALRDRIAEYGVVPGQFAQLLALYEEDDTTQNELCDKVRIDQSTMAHTLKRMERDGLIHRTPDPADGRRARIRLTERARDLQPVLVQAAAEVNEAATRCLSDAQIAALMRTLSQVVDNFDSGRASDG
ncbi:MarR family winged helix-turn-helix transcriptional regulator [Nocardia sp. GCM10030253]|uniref:MarR family winged helix-turn-helix transcriptional regulator n=1 Tax=Nocardia sp. GCM10030253 TaxID=3273404 RepID=UPI0036411670